MCVLHKDIIECEIQAPTTPPLEEHFLMWYPKRHLEKKNHAWFYVPSPGDMFPPGCEIGFGSCSVLLDQGQVNCYLRLEMKLSSQTKNT